MWPSRTAFAHHKRTTIVQVDITPGVDGSWCIFWNPVLCWEASRTFDDTTPAYVTTYPVYTSTPLSLSANLWTTAVGRSPANSIPNAAALDPTLQNSGHVQFCCASVDVIYTGTKLNAGGTYYKVRGDTATPFIYYTSTAITGRACDAFTDIPSICTSHLAEEHVKMHFYPQGEMLENCLIHVPQHCSLEEEDSDAWLPSTNSYNNAPYGWTQGIIGKMAGGANGTVRVRATFHYNVSVTNPITGQLPVMNNDVTSADPQMYAKATTAVAQNNISAVSSGYDPTVISRPTFRPPTAATSAGNGTPAEQRGPVGTLFDAFKDFGQKALGDIRIML